MDEKEFAQAVAVALQKNTREVVLRSMRTKGFSIDGFQNLEKVPVNVLTNALRRTKIKGKQCSAIFLKEVKECDLNDTVIDAVRLWYGSEEDKRKAENRLSELKISLLSVKKGDVILGEEVKATPKDFQSQYTDLKTKLDEQRNKNKQLQGKIQSMKIQLENVQKELDTENKERGWLKKENEQQKTVIENLEQEIKEQRVKVEFYQHVLQRAPKILCFTKTKISEEEMLLYNLTVCSSVDSVTELKWNLFNRIWIAENDFTLE